MRYELYVFQIKGGPLTIPFESSKEIDISYEEYKKSKNVSLVYIKDKSDGTILKQHTKH